MGACLKQEFETASAHIDNLIDRVWPLSDRVSSITISVYEDMPVLGVRFKKNGRIICLFGKAGKDCSVMDEKGNTSDMPVDKAAGKMVNAFVATFPDYAQDEARDFLEGRKDMFAFHGKKYVFQPRRA